MKRLTLASLCALTLVPRPASAAPTRFVADCGQNGGPNIVGSYVTPSMGDFSLWPVSPGVTLEMNSGRYYDPHHCHGAYVDPDGTGGCDEREISDQYSGRGCSGVRTTAVITVHANGKTYSTSGAWALGFSNNVSWNRPGARDGNASPYLVCDGGVGGLRKTGEDLEQKGGVAVDKDVIVSSDQYRDRGLRAFDAREGFGAQLRASDGDTLGIAMRFDGHGHILVDEINGERTVQGWFGPVKSGFFCLIR